MIASRCSCGGSASASRSGRALLPRRSPANEPRARTLSAGAPLARGHTICSRFPATAVAVLPNRSGRAAGGGEVRGVEEAEESVLESGEMEMSRKAMLLLALACTVGSLALLATPGVNGRDSAPLSFVKKTIAAHSIVIFSKSYCPYCKRAKNVFKELNEIPFVVELDQREDGAKIQDALFELVKKRTVPQVFIDGEHIGGSDDTVEAHRNGRLKNLLGSKQSGDQDL